MPDPQAQDNNQQQGNQPQNNQQQVQDYLSADEGGTPSPGNSQQQPAASQQGNSAEPQTPQAGQPDASDQNQQQNQNGQPSNQPAVDLEKQARSALGLENQEPDTVDTIRQRYEASSRENTRIKTKLDAVQGKLTEKGLKVVETDDGIDFVPDKEYTATQSDELTGQILSSLSQSDKDAAADDPDAFAGKVINEVLSKTAGPKPTKSVDEVTIGEPIKQLARATVVNAKDAEGNSKFPDYESLEPYIKSVTDDPSTPSDFTQFMNRSQENYEFGLKLLYGRVHQTVAPLIAAQKDAQQQLQNRQNNAQQDAPLTNQNTNTHGQNQQFSGSNTPDAEADEIANASAIW